LWFGIVGRRAFRRGRLLLTGTLIFALLYALGRYTPFFAFAYAWFPEVEKFRRPVDADFVLVAALALLCGHLLADYVREGAPPRRVPASAIAAAGVAAMLTWGIAFMARSGHGLAALAEVLKTAPIALGAILVLALPRTLRTRQIAAVVVAAVAIGDLMWWNVAFRLNAQPRAYFSVLENPADAPALAMIERLLRERHAQGARPRIEIVGMDGPWQNVAVVAGLEAINGYNPLRIGLYDRLVSPGEANWSADFRNFPASFNSYDAALARALGLEYVILDRPIEQVPHLAHHPVADVLQAGPTVWIYRLHSPSPRVKFSRHILLADADATTAAGALVASPRPDRVLIDDSTPPHKTYAADGSAGDARITTWRPDRVEIETDSRFGGMLALHDIHYPGWIAEIDGARVPVLRADVLFRGIEVPSGHHRVVFSFRPFSIENLLDAAKLVLHLNHLRAG
jgi:hypothetical protein